jgi:hypothetical protein
MNRAYLDTASYLEGCDPSLWSAWEEFIQLTLPTLVHRVPQILFDLARSFKDHMSRHIPKLVEKGDVAAHVVFEAPGEVEEDLRDAVYESGKSDVGAVTGVAVVGQESPLREEGEFLPPLGLFMFPLLMWSLKLRARSKRI